MNVKASEIFKEFEKSGILSSMVGEDRTISGIASVDSGGSGSLVFVDRKEFVQTVRDKRPGAVVTQKEIAEQLKDMNATTVFVSANVQLAHALIKQRYADRDLQNSEWGDVHPSAVIHPTARVPSSVRVGPLAVIGKNVTIGEGTVIMSNSVIEHDAVIGSNTRIFPGVVIGYGCKIGNDVMIKSGSIIGSEGFGFAQDKEKRNYRIPQTGTVTIGDRCVIGSNNTIDRAAYSETKIGAGCVFDNLIHIAHNVEMDEDCIVVAMTGIAGSTKIGKRVLFSGQAGVLDHLNICSDVYLLHRPGVTQDIEAPGLYAGGPPLQPLNDYLKNGAIMKKLVEMKKKVSALEKKLEGMTGAK